VRFSRPASTRALGSEAVNVWAITKVQAYAGHRDIKTTQRYVHHKTKAQDADLGGAYLDAALGEPALTRS
jgi:integrase